MSVLRAAWARVRLKMVAALLLGDALLAFCGYAWLKIPDSHVWELGLSVVLGVGLVAGFFWLQAKAVRSVRVPGDPLALRVGTVVLAGWCAVVWVLRMPAARLDAGAMQRAGYWNSRLGAGARHVFTFDRMYHWQSEAIGFVFSIVVPALVLPFVVETVSRRWSRDVWRNAGRCLRRWMYWVCAVVVLWGGPWVVARMYAWQPGHSVAGEIASVLLRLAAMYALVVLLGLGLVAMAAELLARGDVGRESGL